MLLRSIMNTMSQAELFFCSLTLYVRSTALTHGYIWLNIEQLLQLWVLRHLHGGGLAKKSVADTRQRYKLYLCCQRHPANRGPWPKSLYHSFSNSFLIFWIFLLFSCTFN